MSPFTGGRYMWGASPHHPNMGLGMGAQPRHDYSGYGFPAYSPYPPNSINNSMGGGPPPSFQVPRFGGAPFPGASATSTSATPPPPPPPPPPQPSSTGSAFFPGDGFLRDHSARVPYHPFFSPHGGQPAVPGIAGGSNYPGIGVIILIMLLLLVLFVLIMVLRNGHTERAELRMHLANVATHEQVSAMIHHELLDRGLTGPTTLPISTAFTDPSAASTSAYHNTHSTSSAYFASTAGSHFPMGSGMPQPPHFGGAKL